MLDAKQLRSYRDDGYVVVRGLLSADEVGTLQAVTDKFMERSRAVNANDDTFDLEPGHSAANPRLRRIKLPEKRDPAYAALKHHPGIMAILQQLLGPDIRFDIMKLNLKPGGGGEAVEWHQDWAFYPHTNDDLLAVGIMLDDMTPENGPLLMVPGSHRGPVLNHHQDGIFVGGVTDPAAAPLFDKAVPILGKAGDVSFHHVRLLHGSAVNTSERHRRLLLLQMRAADAWPLISKGNSFEDYNSLMLSGEPSVVPRIASVPVRLPLPRAEKQAESIFEKQKQMRVSFFEKPVERAAAAAKREPMPVK